MHKRTLLATATLTALLLSVGSLQPVPTGVDAELAPHALGVQTGLTAEAPVGPQWGEAFDLGIWWGVLSAAVCLPFTGVGAFACGVAGAA